MQWKVHPIGQPVMTRSVVGLIRSSKALPKAKLAPKKGSWSLFDGLLLIWSTSFWIPVKPLHLRSMLSKSVRCMKKQQHLQLALVKRMGPLLYNNSWLHIAQPTLQKLNELVYEVLPHPPYQPDLLPTDYHFFKHLNNFLQGKCLHNQQEA